jgi:hypothetical protein
MEKRILLHGNVSILRAVVILFSMYYILNLSYPTDGEAFLEFFQR